MVPAATTENRLGPKPEGEPPHLFGYGLRDRVLMTLAANRRPLYVGELCRMLDADNRKVRNTLIPLLRCRVLVKDDRRFGARYVGLNRGFPAYKQLLELLRAIERRYPQPRIGKPARKAERFALRDLLLVPIDEEVQASDLDLLFYTANRSRVLLAVAAMPDTDATDISKTLGLEVGSVWNAVNHWQQEGIVRSTVIGRRRALDLDPRYIAARELRHFLRRLVKLTEDYAVLSSLSTRNPNSGLFVARR